MASLLSFSFWTLCLNEPSGRESSAVEVSTFMLILVFILWDVLKNSLQSLTQSRRFSTDWVFLMACACLLLMIFSCIISQEADPLEFSLKSTSSRQTRHFKATCTPFSEAVIKQILIVEKYWDDYECSANSVFDICFAWMW